MAIQNRRGNSRDYDPTKMLAGEFGFTTDGTKKVYAAFGPGNDREVYFRDEANAEINPIKILAENNAESVTELTEDVTNIIIGLEGKVDGAYVEDGYLFLTSNDDVVAGPLGPFSGGGGGGGGGGTNNAVLTFTNTSGYLAKTIALGADCVLSANWTSLEGDIPTGSGALKITVNGSVKSHVDVAQGDISVNVGKYLKAGNNIVKLNISDVYGNSRTINYNISAVDVRIESTFDAAIPYYGAINYVYSPIGKVEKVVHFAVDGTEIGTATITISGGQQNYTIPAQDHGSHTLQVYFTAEIDGQEVRSNELYYDLICLERGREEVVIASSFREKSIEQYTSVAIPWRAYNPLSLTSEVTLIENGVETATLTVDRTEQIWTYRADTVGEVNLEIRCGGTTKAFAFNVTESGISVDAVTNDLALHLTSYGRSNNEEHPEVWASGSVAAELTGFNFTSDGWQKDANNITVLRVSGDARVNIPLEIFGKDFRTTGKTIELELATHNVMNYDTDILSCYADGRGIQVTPQRATLRSEQSELFAPYKEDEHVRISFVVNKKADNRIVYCYINGVMSRATQYPDDDDFSQAHPVGIRIGSNDCTTDIYNIRVYDNNLTRQQMLNNWIADTQEGALLVERYLNNAVFDEYGQIVIDKLPKSTGYLVLKCPELPQYKGDKKVCSGYYTDRTNPTKSFTFEDAEIDVQGTSSAGYVRKNYKVKYKGGFIMPDGTTAKTYAMNDTAIPVNTFTYKADVASSEGANNVEAVRLYNDICPYSTPAQLEDERVRQGIDGFPIVIFHDNGEDVTFIGKYNFNNDKGTEAVFGFEPGDESWEVRNNTSDRVLWRSADFAGDDWLNDFEARYPDGYEDPEQLARFATWLTTTDQSAATGEALASAVEYEGVTYTNDTAEYRLAKFKSEAADYMELDSAVFYYLFTEVFLAVDSRAKNMFPSFIGSEVTK